MDKEEAMKILKDFHDESAIFSVRTALETLHPELAESEDEKVRKALIEMVHDTTGDELWIDYNVHKEDALAWLKKQGKEDSSIQQAYEWGYTEGKRIERKHWIEKQNFSEDYNSIDPQFGKPIEQNPAWSEEDETALGDALWCCKQAASIAKDENDMGNVWYAERWLKSLKDRVQPQQKWSEEDEKKQKKNY